MVPEDLKDLAKDLYDVICEVEGDEFPDDVAELFYVLNDDVPTAPSPARADASDLLADYLGAYLDDLKYDNLDDDEEHHASVVAWYTQLRRQARDLRAVPLVDAKLRHRVTALSIILDLIDQQIDDEVLLRVESDSDGDEDSHVVDAEVSAIDNLIDEILQPLRDELLSLLGLLKEASHDAE